MTMAENVRKRVKFWIVYLTVSAAFVVVALEVLARLFHLAPQLVQEYGDQVKDSRLPFKPRPFSTLSGKSGSGEYTFEYKHNSLGFRDVEHDTLKPEGVFRIIGLGDSFTYGAGASFKETYLYRLEAMLNERQGEHPKVEIIKAF